MKYLMLGGLSLFLMLPAMFLLFSSIIHQDNTYDWWLVAIAVVLFVIPLVKVFFMKEDNST